MYKLAVVFVVLGVVLGDSSIREWSAEDYPNPRENSYECGRRDKKNSWVCDPNEILTFDEANQLDRVLEELHNMTRCPCSAKECSKDRRGYHVAVALANKIIRGPTYKIANEDNGDDPNDVGYKIQERLHKVELFSVVTKNQWSKVGFGRCEEDVIIVYSMADNVVYAMAGMKASQKLKPGLIGEIIESARLQFGADKNRDKFQGLRQIVTSFKAVFTGHYETVYRQGGAHPTPARLMSNNLSDSAPSHTPLYATFLTTVVLIITHYLF